MAASSLHGYRFIVGLLDRAAGRHQPRPAVVPCAPFGNGYEVASRSRTRNLLVVQFVGQVDAFERLFLGVGVVMVVEPADYEGARVLFARFGVFRLPVAAEFLAVLEVDVVVGFGAAVPHVVEKGLAQERRGRVVYRLPYLGQCVAAVLSVSGVVNVRKRVEHGDVAAGHHAADVVYGRFRLRAGRIGVGLNQAQGQTESQGVAEPAPFLIVALEDQVAVRTAAVGAEGFDGLVEFVEEVVVDILLLVVFRVVVFAEIGGAGSEVGYVAVYVGENREKVYLEDTGDGVEVGVAGITVRPAHQIDDVLDLVLVHEVPQTHNLEVPGLSPGWSTLKIKQLQSFCRCFFFYR